MVSKTSKHGKQKAKDMSNPKYPLFIVSKGRADTRYTARYLDYMNVPYRLVVEPDEYNLYVKAVGDKNKVLQMDMSYKEKYDTCDELGLNKSTGPGPARNFVWDYSIDEGYDYHWVMDDNIRSFRRYNKNEKVKVSSGTIFAAMEDFIERYEKYCNGWPKLLYVPTFKTKKPHLLY